jgi:predicted RNA-binding protein associated with RNAse of E/G family
MSLNALPAITEVKVTLAGARKTFSCQVVDRSATALVVLFVSKAPVKVHDLELPAGTVTFGYFWVDRSFNVYHWMSPAGATLAFYVNLAEGTTLAGETLFWRDLTLDVLIRPGAAALVLDEDELPPDLDADTWARIDRARAEVLSRAQTLPGELEAASDAYWPRVFGLERRR